MGAKKISALAAATLPLTGAERFAAVQAGATVGVMIDAVVSRVAAKQARAINVKDAPYNAVGDGSADDSAAILAAYAAAVSTPWVVPVLFFPPGTYRLINTVWTIIAPRLTVRGEDAIIKTYGTSQVQIGDASHPTFNTKFVGIKFQTDAAASASAPVSIYSGNAIFNDCDWLAVNKNLTALRVGSIIFNACTGSLAAGASGGSIVAANIPAGQAAAVVVQGGVFSGQVDGGQYAFDCSGAGHLDGICSLGAGYGNYTGIVNYHPTSGGSLTNTQFYANLFDQVGGKAFNFAPPSGASVGDVDISGNTINGSLTDVTTSGAIISLDLTSGATHGATNFKVADNTFKDVRVRVMEVLGGTLKTVMFSRNSCADYGRVFTLAGALTGRMLYIAGTIDCLEVVDNHSRTTLGHDYDVEFGAVTISKSKIEGNTFRGTAATLSEFNNYSFHSRRERLTANRSIFVNPLGSDSNTGAHNTAAEAFLTIQAAWDYAAGAFDLNGFTLTIKLADGTYTGGLTATKFPIGSGTVQIQGNSSTPANVIVAKASGDCFKVVAATNIVTYVRDLQMQTTVTGYCLNCQARAQLQFGNVIFAGAASGHIISQAGGGLVNAAGTYSITGDAPAHFTANYGGQITVAGLTPTITGSRTFSSAFAVANVLALIRCDSSTFTGTVTGNRYAVTTGAVINTNGGGANFFPGSSPGTNPSGYYS